VRMALVAPLSECIQAAERIKAFVQALWVSFDCFALRMSGLIVTMKSC
jgi:hypothetical protein